MRRFKGMVVCALVLGCRGDARRPQAQPSIELHGQERDSAGVRIIEYAGVVSELPVAFTIADEPTLDLGGPRDPIDHELGPGEHNSARLSDGRIVVTERTHLKVFDGKGRYTATLGKPGKGPGEFS